MHGNIEQIILQNMPQSSDETSKNPNTLLDSVNFKYLISISECKFLNKGDSKPFVIIAVNSNPTEKEMRQTIRDSWGHYAANVKTYFFLGRVHSDQIQQDVEAEDTEFGDIIQGNFIDNQRTFAYKHVMMLKWFSECCADAKYLIKMDDDVFANVPAINDFLRTNPIQTNLLMGKYQDPKLCPRNGTWAVSRVEYASDFYPTYAARHSIIYSRDVAIKLLNESNLVNFFWVEDVFVTGILRTQINIDITPLDKYILNETSLPEMKEASMNLPNPPNFMFSLPELTISDQLLIWERTEWYRLGEKERL